MYVLAKASLNISVSGIIIECVCVCVYSIYVYIRYIYTMPGIPWHCFRNVWSDSVTAADNMIYLP
jgi:hypothetical protein